MTTMACPYSSSIAAEVDNIMAYLQLPFFPEPEEPLKVYEECKQMVELAMTRDYTTLHEQVCSLTQWSTPLRDRINLYNELWDRYGPVCHRNMWQMEKLVYESRLPGLRLNIPPYTLRLHSPLAEAMKRDPLHVLVAGIRSCKEANIGMPYIPFMHQQLHNAYEPYMPMSLGSLLATGTQDNCEEDDNRGEIKGQHLEDCEARPSSGKSSQLPSTRQCKRRNSNHQSDPENVPPARKRRALATPKAAIAGNVAKTEKTDVDPLVAATAHHRSRPLSNSSRVNIGLQDKNEARDPIKREDTSTPANLKAGEEEQSKMGVAPPTLRRSLRIQNLSKARE